MGDVYAGRDARGRFRNGGQGGPGRPRGAPNKPLKVTLAASHSPKNVSAALDRLATENRSNTNESPSVPVHHARHLRSNTATAHGLVYWARPSDATAFRTDAPTQR